MTTPFSAADSALGYPYQVRVALLWSLRRGKVGGDFIVSLETLDDVTFESKGGTPEELLQTKHHRTREAALSDASGDLWKSMRVWFEGHANKQIPTGTALYLVTPGAAPKGGAASYLRSEGRDVAKALSILEAVPQTSESQATRRHTRHFSPHPPLRVGRSSITSSCATARRAFRAELGKNQHGRQEIDGPIATRQPGEDAEPDEHRGERVDPGKHERAISRKQGPQETYHGPRAVRN